MIYFRADANEVIASGHIMRCITIALEFVKQEKEVTFLIADANPQILLERYKLSYRILNTDWENMESEINILNGFLNTTEDIVIVDSYMVTEAYMKALYTKVKTVYIEDHMKCPYNVDILINYNLYHFIFDYLGVYKKTETKLLLGAQYVPLREEFSSYHIKDYEVREKVNDVLVMCGGSDEKGFLKVFLNKLCHMKSLRFHVIVGAYNAYREEIKKRYDGQDNIYIYENINNISEIMAKCDVAISAAGNTLYELCAVGTPTIFFSYSDNQKYDDIGFTQNDIMLHAGNIDDGMETMIETMIVYINILADSREARIKMSKKMRDLVDGLGAARIVRSILEDEKNVNYTSA